MTTQLTLYYAICTGVLLLIASGLLYWALVRGLARENEDYLAHKMQVLALILAKQPLDLSGLEQEVRDEARISAHSQAPYLLRVLDREGRLVAETPGMATQVPVAVFPQPRAGLPREGSGQLGGHTFLLATMAVTAPRGGGWQIEAALDTDASDGLLARYRRDVALVLGVGVLLAAVLGAGIARRGLRPIAAITRATERIGAQRLEERILPGAWPKELAALATEFDRMLERLQESFERLSQFSADLAHELRTPINNLMGEAQVALSRARPAEEYARVLQSALEEHARLARTIDSMLFLAQADQARLSIAPAPLEGRAELQAVAEFYQALAEEQGVRLRCEGERRIEADALLLRRALSNLVSNALKCTPRGGSITLRAGTGDGEAPVLSVSDSGPGIGAEHLARLGDRFYRIDPARAAGTGGVGLGLAIVRSIMTLHGGALRIESALGAGTTASLVFPADVKMTVRSS